MADEDVKRLKEASDEVQTAAIPKIMKLPLSMMSEILSRLPVKSLARCRCVCKSWNQLMSDSLFVKLQLSKSPTCILYRKLDEPRTIKFAHPVRDATGEGFHVERIDFVAKTNLPDTEFDFVNACNGLLCLVDITNAKHPKTLYVCNPILGEHVAITVQARNTQLFGFGFSTSTNKYKVLQTYATGVDSDSKMAEIYTLGTGQWRSIGTTLSSLDAFMDFNTFLNGCLHWVIFKHICCFDFESENFRTLPSPPPYDVSRDTHETVKLAVLNGCLCASYRDLNLEACDIWIMKEFGVQDSWTRLFLVKNLNLSPYNFEYYEMLYLFNNVEILMLHYGGGVVRYNAETESYEDTPIIQPTGLTFPTAFKPCFVSPKNAAIGEQLNDVAGSQNDLAGRIQSL